MSDARLVELRDCIDTMTALSLASAEARRAGATAYWYFVSEDYCPVCGRTDASRERMYTPRPERWEDRHSFTEVYDWCDS